MINPSTPWHPNEVCKWNLIHTQIAWSSRALQKVLAAFLRSNNPNDDVVEYTMLANVDWWSSAEFYSTVNTTWELDWTILFFFLLLESDGV